MLLADYLITNPSTLGESVSLHKECHHAIYIERNYITAPYVQSRDRIHRVWIENGKQVDYKTYYYHIVSDNTIDENIYNRVNSKFKRMIDLIEDDIPLFTDAENQEETRKILINEIINNYNE